MRAPPCFGVFSQARCVMEFGRLGASCTLDSNHPHGAFVPISALCAS